MRSQFLLGFVLVTTLGCGSSGGGGAPSTSAGGSTSSGGATSTGGTTTGSSGGTSSNGGTATGSGGGTSSNGSASGNGGTSSGGGATGNGGATAIPDGGATGAIGEWTDSPGACPAGVPRVDIDSATNLASAARGEGAYASDAPGTCYFIKNGTYTDSGVILYVLKGGASGGARRLFVGESRQGVVIHGRGNVEDGVSDVTIANLTFDLTGYPGSGAFNTLNLGNGKNVTLDHVTFTGDCNTGLQGGHIETNLTDNVLVDSCLVEKFGHCSGGGHEDHGIYLAGGSHITIRNSVISGNSSRGIQMYTQQGQYGTLSAIRVEQCRIFGNGHADYEDGVVINAAGTGTITDVTLTRNLIYRNYYSGVRFVGGAESSVVIDQNTFASNGAGSTSASRSEINIDSAGGGAGTTMTANLFFAGNLLINDCYDAASLGFGIGLSFVDGVLPAGAKASCVAGGLVVGDPGFVDAASGDFRTTNSAAAPFGAYAP